MLEEMGNSVVLVVLVTRAGVNPNANGGGLLAAVLRRHSHAIVQLCQLGRWQVDQLLFHSRSGGSMLESVKKLNNCRVP